MADREDFATAVGGLIKNHVPTRISLGDSDLLLDTSGGIQFHHSGERKLRILSTGELVEGTVPWDRITGKPATEPVWQADIPTAAGWRTDVQTEVKAYRSGNVVTVAAWRLASDASDAGEVLAYTLPLGYRPAGLTQQYVHDSRGAEVSLLYTGEVHITNPPAAVAHHSFTFVTLDPLPA